MGGENIQIVHYFDHGFLEEEKPIIHNFTVTFGAKYLTGMVTSVPPYETFSLIKNNILHQSKIYKNQKFLRYVTFRSRWSCDIQFHKCAVYINVGSLMISSAHKSCLGTTTNAVLSCELDSAYGEVVLIKLKVVHELRQVGGFLWVLWVSSTI